MRLAGSGVSPRQAQTPRQGGGGSSSALLQEQLDRASRAAEAAVIRAAEAEARAGALSAELQAARQAEQVCFCPGHRCLATSLRA